MRQAHLLGVSGHKRTRYFQKAAEEAELFPGFSDWKLFLEHPSLPEQDLFVKLDPFPAAGVFLQDLEQNVRAYRTALEGLEESEKLRRQNGLQTRWLNTPGGILSALNKRESQRRLSQAGIPATGERLKIQEKKGFSGGEELLSWMAEQRESQIFLKPVWGSGAAGVCALRFHPEKGTGALYTCAASAEDNLRRQSLINTKKLRVLRDRKEIAAFLDQLLSMDCLAERWYPKASFQGCSYDLRAVWQFGQLDFLLARLSKGPLTNLHLNNHPLPAKELGLPLSVREEIEELCRRTALAFPGLSSFGADILLERGSLRPRIIEINGQGDLLYQDIYQENKIYRRQAEVMKAWIKEQGEGFETRRTV